jgi:hypothetical protein
VEVAVTLEAQCYENVDVPVKACILRNNLREILLRSLLVTQREMAEASGNKGMSKAWFQVQRNSEVLNCRIIGAIEHLTPAPFDNRAEVFLPCIDE